MNMIFAKNAICVAAARIWKMPVVMQAASDAAGKGRETAVAQLLAGTPHLALLLPASQHRISPHEPASSTE
ncbi:hypothetical protein UB46_08485 [Burkholderiaceae bacterium 16]|nr:hypothetical protein UB46_08485 [Burkholderiaceae bacterium 16]